MDLRLIQRLKQHARERPDAMALRGVDGGAVATWRQLEAASRQVANWVDRHVHGAAVVLLRGGNEPATVAAFCGILRAGAKVFPLSPQATHEELTVALAATRASAIISADTAAVIDTPSITTVRFSDLIREPDSAPDDDHWSSSEQGATRTGAALLLGSSGTTGKAKIVHRSGGAIDAVIDAMCDAVGFQPTDRVLAAVPLYHSYGVEHGLLAPIAAGSCVDLMNGFELAQASAALENGVTIFPAVPFMLDALAQAPPGISAPQLRRVYSAGGPLPLDVAAAFSSRFGIGVGQIYGSTEVGSVTYSDPLRSDFDPASVGRPMNGVEIVLSHEAEIGIRAPSMLDGYLSEDGVTSAATANDFYMTGDLGRVDANGNLTLTGRIKLLIDVGGLKVNPLEVEQVLGDHPSVGSAVVLPLPVSSTVNRLRAIVSPRPGGPAPEAEELRKYVRSRLSLHKVPRVIEIRDSLPMSGAGKVQRNLV